MTEFFAAQFSNPRRAREVRFPNRPPDRCRGRSPRRAPLQCLGGLETAAPWVIETNVKKFWLVKQEPSAYSWANFVADGKTSWTGVRNYTARNNLRAMSNGDEVLFYHSVTDKAVIGIAQVSRTAYADPTATEGDWSAVDLKPKRALARPDTLDA